MTTSVLPWYRRAFAAFRGSLRLRLVLVFLLLAMGMAFTFISGAQKAFSVGWREAARPLLMDYVDRLGAEVVVGGTPSVERAQALTQRLPVTIAISGPLVNWRSHPDQVKPHWKRDRPRSADGDGPAWGDDQDWDGLLL
ncbi:MAG: two-component sensor histidine kinase, partial [Hydrogenophaga sp.]